jgi:isocitrate/isopropylmalate dehydrogenase
VKKYFLFALSALILLRMSAAALLTATKKVLAERKVRTGDMGGTNSTSEMGDAIVAALRA